MDVNLTTATGRDSKSKVSLTDETFGRDYNEALVHQVVTAYMAGARAGTRAQKNRSEVSGGGAKPWRQKGTGRARAGTIRSPLWRTGGVTFAAVPRDYSQKVNRKMYRAALSSMLSELLRQERLLLVDKFAVDAPKTRELTDRLGKLGLDNVLIVSDDPDVNLYLSARNLHKVDVSDVASLNPLGLIQHDKVLMTVEAAKKIEEMLS